MKKHDSESTLQRLRTNIATWQIGVTLLALGALSFIAIGLWLDPNGTTSRILAPIAGAILTTGLISLGWELTSRRAFADELDRRYNLTQDIKSSGLLSINKDYQSIIDWDHEIEAASTIEVAIAYSSTWFTSHESAFQRFLSNPKKTLTCFIADRNDSDTIRQMVSRFPSRNESRIVQGSSDTESRIREAAENAGSAGAKLHIIPYKRPLDFALYRFDEKILVTLYGRGSKLDAFPVMTFDIQGATGAFFKKELDSLRPAHCLKSDSGANS